MNFISQINTHNGLLAFDKQRPIQWPESFTLILEKIQN